jgi:hypothetical protein
MTMAAPRIPQRLLDAIERLDDRRLPFAETTRRVGAEAARLGLPRPSYEQIRVHAHRARRIRAQPSTAEVLLDVALRVRPPEELLTHLSGGTLAPR